MQALADARSATSTPYREPAAAFFRGSEGLRFWCHIAGLRWQTDRALALQVLRDPGPRQRQRVRVTT